MTQPGYDPNQHIQVITKPGGLSGAAHAVHILICLFTCGLWLPGYLIIMAMAPRQRFEVVAPYGADPNLVASAQLEAEAHARARTRPNPVVPAGAIPSVPDVPDSNRTIALRVFAIFGALVAVFVVIGFVGSRLFG